MSIFDRFKYISDTDLYFSEGVGRGLYFLTGEHMFMPLDIQGDEPPCPIFVDYLTGELYFARKIRPFAHSRALVRYSQDTMDREMILWPNDVIELNMEDGEEIDNYLETFYDASNEPVWSEAVWKAVLFPIDACVPGRSLKTILRDIKAQGKLNYQNPEVISLAKKILTAFQKLNEKGYLYLEFSFDKLHLTEQGKIYFDFSNLIYRINDTKDIDRVYENRLEENWIPVEFAEPAVIQGKWSFADERTQNYSLAAMIFYLIFGIHAYDGRLMDDYETDDFEIDSLLQFYEKYEDYHRMPIFVFDPDDKSNSLGEFGADRKVIDLWEKAPDEIKSKFQKALAKSNAERTGEMDMNLTPKEWMETFEAVDW